MPVAVLARNIWGHGPMASAAARASNRGLGQSPQRDPGAEPMVSGSGGKTPVKLKHFWYLDAVNLPNFLQFKTAKK